MAVLREGLDPLTCSVPLPSTLPFLHGTPTTRRFSSDAPNPFTTPPPSPLLFPGPITNEEK